MSDLVIGDAKMNLRWYSAAERNYVLATWLRSANERRPQWQRGEAFYSLARPAVEYVVDHGDTIVLCDAEMPSVTCGWAASLHGRLVWMYVMPALRRQGAGKFLVSSMSNIAEGMVKA